MYVGCTPSDVDIMEQEVGGLGEAIWFHNLYYLRLI